MSDAADLGAFSARPTPADDAPREDAVPTGIAPLDERTGGLERGGSYLLVGAPGPAKMVAALQFVHRGVTDGEQALLLTNADAEGILGVARAWGLALDEPWMDGRLRILGFRDDFELRAIRSIEPEEVVEELEELAGRDVARIAVDPGTMFLAGGARSLLGSAYLKWARIHPATVCSTFSVDGVASSLPSSADWMVNATTGRLVIEWRSEELYQITPLKAVPGPHDTEEAVSVQLRPGAGLVAPDGFPARRGRDRPGIDEGRLLLISLGGAHAADVETWARSAYTADVVSEPFQAVANVQEDASFGGILVHAPRNRIREAVQACRALRPLTRAAIVFASDDAVRSTDRINILEAGADDCLSGGIDFRELDLRIRQAIAAGSKPIPDDPSPGDGPSRSVAGAPDGGRVSRDVFASEISRRAGDPVERFFCVLDVTSDALEGSTLESVLTQHVRADEGDLVTRVDGRCAVLLQGAREAQLGPFLERLRTRLREAADGARSAEPSVTVLSHPADAERISALLRTTSGAEG